MSSVCLSVCPSMRLVISDHIGWKSWKLIAQTISPTPPLFVMKQAIHLLPGENGEIFGRLYRWGREKVACWRTRAVLTPGNRAKPCKFRYVKPVGNFIRKIQRSNKKSRIFDDTTSPANPDEYRHKTYIARNHCR